MNILIAGVGGQGTLLASKILGMVAEKQSLDVKLSEVHGMAQRGGSVITCVKIAEKGMTIASPIIDEGDADVILAFEQLEAVRWLSFLKKDGTVIMNTQRISPMPVISGIEKYPTDIIEAIKDSNIKVIALDALSIAEECGNKKAVNVVLIGVLSTITKHIEKDIWIDSLKSIVPAKVLEINEKAFYRGQEFGESV